MKRLFILLISILTIAFTSNAYFNIDGQNVHLQSGIWNSYKVPNSTSYYVGVEISVKVTGWPIKNDLSNLWIERNNNGVIDNLPPSYFNEDENEYTYLSVETDGNTSYVYFRDIFIVDDINDLDTMLSKYTIFAQKGGNKPHWGSITVNFYDNPTDVHDIFIQRNELYYDLQGHSSKTPFKGVNIHKGKKILF